jgi:hypothetical protein
VTIKLQDVDKAEAWAVGGILPPGWHNVQIISAEESQSSGGHPQIELDLESVSGDGKIKDWIVVMAQTLGKVRQLIDAAGVDIQAGEWEFDPATLKGCAVSILVREEPKYGDPSTMVNKVVGYEPPRANLAMDAANGSHKTHDDIPF